MKTAVVTGCTKGIGAAIAELFINKGCKVCGCYSGDEENAHVFLEKLDGKKSNCSLVKVDLSTRSGIDSFIEFVKNKCDTIDYLVLNAGMTDRTPFQSVSHDMWDKVMNLNLNAPFFIVQGLNDIIQKDGRIIFIGSVLGSFPHAMSISYAVSKAGIHQLAKNLVKEFADRKITVNSVAPGFVDTPWQKAKDPQHRKRIEDKTALKRFAEPEEIAHLCWEIVENPYINGSVLKIDGGYDYK